MRVAGSAPKPLVRTRCCYTSRASLAYMTDTRPIASRSSRSPCMPPSVTAVTAVTTADADERTRVRAAHAIGARCRGEAQPRCNDSRSAVQALRTARVSQVRRTRVCERVLKNAFLDTTLRKLTVTHTADRTAHRSQQSRPSGDSRRARGGRRAKGGRGTLQSTRSRAGILRCGDDSGIVEPVRGGDDGEAAVETTATSNLCTDAPDGAPPLGERKDALDTVALRRCRAQVASVAAAAAAAS